MATFVPPKSLTSGSDLLTYSQQFNNNATGIENQGQMFQFFIPIKFTGGVGEMS